MIKSIIFSALLFINFGGPVFGASLFHAQDDWKRLDMPRQPATQFEFTKSDELKVTADQSVAFFFRELSPDDQKKTALHWRWRVEKSFPATNLSKKSTDDRPLAVHIWFGDSKFPSFFNSLGSLFGAPRNGRMITYVFGGNHPPGTIIQNPYFDQGVLIVLQGPRAELNRWYLEKRNIEADYRKSFPTAPKMLLPRYIVVSADTDGTKAKSVARISNLHLSVYTNHKLMH
ncbi:MAG: DUF3047 domain-containing protein [Rhodospirillales bacterium]